ncbi:MAG: hypothetical protein ACI9CA_000444 [Natronomonas sp.]|jgi:hypothetical protein
MTDIPAEDADQLDDPDPPIPAASPPPFSDDVVAAGPLIIKPNEATRIRSAEVREQEMGYVASEMETVTAFIADRGRAEIEMPEDLETLASWVNGELDRPDFAPPTPRHQAVQTPLVTIDRAEVREALGDVRLGAASVYPGQPEPVAVLPWERVEAAVRTLLALTGEEYDPDHIRCYECGFDGILVVYQDESDADLLGGEVGPDAIREAVYIRPRRLNSADAERQPHGGPNADVDFQTVTRPDGDYQQALIEREQRLADEAEPEA